MSKTYRRWEPTQELLMPPSLREWLPEDHLAYFVLDVVKTLDLSSIRGYYERERRGQPPHHPEMMVALLLYGYCVGVPSSRKMERRTYDDVAFRVIAAGQHPDHVRISEFRRIHLGALAGLFVQVLRLCQKAKLVRLGVVALDGTKVKANASKHKAMSYARMQQDEEKLQAKVAALLRAAEEADASEDEEYGRGRRGDELPEDLRHAQSRLARIQALKAELEAEAKAQSEEPREDGDSDDEPPSAGSATPLPKHQVPRGPEGTPTNQAQRNFTDGDSRIMRSGDGFVQAYNCQAVVDGANQVIIAAAVTNQPPDVEHLTPMIERAIMNCGDVPAVVVGDAGYYSEENAIYALNQGIDAHLATGRQKHNEEPPTVRGRTPKHLTIKGMMRRKLATKRGRRIYARRKVIVEPVFGQIKEARGFRRFLLRGLTKVRAEWSLIAATHNLLKLFGALHPA